MRKQITIILFFLLYSVLGGAQTLESTISSTVIRYGEPIVLKLEVKGNKQDTIIFPKIKDTLSYHLEILDNKQGVFYHQGKYVHTDSISFSAYEEGNFTVPSLTVVVNSKEYHTPKYSIKVDSMMLDTLKQSLYDIRPIIVDPKNFWDYLEQYWVYAVMVLAILIIGIIVLVLYYLERKKKGKDKLEVSPDVSALSKINKLKKTNYLEKGMSKKFYSELTKILKEYIEQWWKFPASKLFSDDLVKYMEERAYINQTEQKDLQAIFKAADFVKFAKSIPAIQESEVHIELAIKFIEKSKDIIILENEHIY